MLCFLGFFTLVIYFRNEKINDLGFISLRFFVMRTLKNYIANKLREYRLSSVLFPYIVLMHMYHCFQLQGKTNRTQTNKKI